jgi:hypothetical protein
MTRAPEPTEPEASESPDEFANPTRSVAGSLPSAPDPVMHVGDTALPLENPGAL